MTTKLPNNSFINLGSGTFTYGDSAGDLQGAYIGGDDVFLGAKNATGWTAVGDAAVLEDGAVGGNDKFVGGDNSSGGEQVSIASEPLGFYGEDSVVFYGDGEDFYGGATGGKDVMTGGANANTVFVGDAGNAYADDAPDIGGNDTMKGSNAAGSATLFETEASNLMFGDFSYAYGYDYAIRGGADIMVAGNATSTNGYADVMNEVFGDFGEDQGGIGGNDTITGGGATTQGGDASTTNVIGGDGAYDGYGTGGNDVVTGGAASVTANGGSACVQNAIAGDSFFEFATVTGEAHNGNDSLIGGAATLAVGVTCGSSEAYNFMAGDAWAFSGDGGGVSFGNDVLVGGRASGDGAYVENDLYGDIGDVYLLEDALNGSGPGIGFGSSGSHDCLHYGNDTLSGGGVSLGGEVDNYLYGDDVIVGVYSVGGNDSMKGGDGDTWNMMVGDGEDMAYHSQGGNDSMIGGGAGSENYMYGDGEDMWEGSHGGSDTMTGGGASSENDMYGDAFDMHESSQGGDDKMTGGGTGSENWMYGDSYYMYGLFGEDIGSGAHGGNDTMAGGNGTGTHNYLYGDAYEFSNYNPSNADAAHGGNDSITGGGAGTVNYLYGDAEYLDDYGVGGNDTLVSGAGTDYMWGDAAYGGEDIVGGADQFVFKTGNGHDLIYDFHGHATDHDQVVLSGLKSYIANYTALQSRMEQVGSDVVIHLDKLAPHGTANTVTLLGVSLGDLNPTDFVIT
ncbi:MAG TPA: hypothetical protein VHA82_00565 [Ramlibacter sp.]|uniref:hypothetical protein n=1 Tax=Ramlibacter sp. TaxID=1917967 RepID=UPI002C0F9BED|nr:hypothetical protein [Ramlibacter sp.]HVZ42272.1 hypothetical protein [Ramlibacter sp.]